ncbi:MAG TPA: MFS transporter [Longimicrobiaceae bacterium]|nr:MFS transporter [Longimicrobiaceae bacterium]
MAATTTAPVRGRPHYAWIVAGVTFVTLLAAAGVRATPGVLMVPLEEEFGWTRATLSLAVSVNLVLYGLMGPFAAAIMDRLGVRRTMLLSLGTIAAGVAATAWMTAPWQLVLLWGVVVGGGTGMTALVLGATVVSRWFTARRGLVMGILTASTATGQLVFLPLLAALVERSGWRAAVLLVAGAAALVFPLVALLMRDSPQRHCPHLPGGRRRTRCPSAGAATRPRRRSRRSPTACARATSGCWRAPSSSAGRAPTGWWART